VIQPPAVVDPDQPAAPFASPLAINAGEPVTRVPRHVTRHLLKGSFALGFSVSVERGMGFIANILAARLGGAQTFGAYSLAISTANNISTYAGGGIGSTAARFSGKYPRGGAGYSTLARALAVVSLFSAVIAATGLWLGAGPIAHLMQKPTLTGLLHWTAISAVGIILLECARGFFIGQGRLPALVLLSLIVGSGMVLLLPFAALSHNPVRMIVLQGAITTSAVVVCLLLAKRLGLLSPEGSGTALPLLPMLREVWGFGVVQLGGLIGVNFAGWWLTTLLARSDTTLVQMSFFAIASQLRNIAGLAPSMLTESSYAVMGEREGQASNTPQQVMALCTFASAAGAFVLAGLGIVATPLALRLMYGRGYTAAASAVVMALAVAVVHMGNAPAAARLSIVSIRAVGVINTVWAVFVAIAATLFLLHHGSAWKAMAIYLGAHLLSSGLVLVMLYRKDHIPEGMAGVYYLASGTAAALAALAALRIAHPQQTWVITAGMTALFAVVTWVMLAAGRRHGWVPGSASLRQIAAGQLMRIRQIAKRRGDKGGE
jgi:O-antigen/teichoic acid export membrane protein